MNLVRSVSLPETPVDALHIRLDAQSSRMTYASVTAHLPTAFFD